MESRFAHDVHVIAIAVSFYGSGPFAGPGSKVRSKNTTLFPWADLKERANGGAFRSKDRIFHVRFSSHVGDLMKSKQIPTQPRTRPWERYLLKIKFMIWS